MPRALLKHALFPAVAAALVGMPIPAHRAAAAVAPCAAGSFVAAAGVMIALADGLGEGVVRQPSEPVAATAPAAGRPAQGSPA